MAGHGQGGGKRRGKGEGQQEASGPEGQSPSGDGQEGRMTQRRDPLGRVSARVDALLDLVREKLRHHELIAEQIAHELRGPVAKAATAVGVVVEVTVHTRWSCLLCLAVVLVAVAPDK